MRLKITKTKSDTNYYIIKDVTKNGKRTTQIYEKLGNIECISKRANGEAPLEWINKYIENLNNDLKKGNENIVIKKSTSSLLKKDVQNSFNIGYVFLQKIYNALKLNEICKDISKKYKFEYDLDSILSRLIYTRILEPSSKLSSFEASKKFLEQPNFELQHIYRALEVIAKETENIEAEVYKNSLNLVNRNTKILYYDCTNYFFETEEAEGIKQYGVSKEHRPNPIVQMGLFMDGDGFPLAFSINSGNTNEQVTLKPLEQQIIKDFGLSKFVVCTDAGLASNENRVFNNIQNRSFVVTQSLKKIKGHLKEWALSPEGWRKNNSKEIVNLESIDSTSNIDDVYYKERWIKENGLEQRLIVSYSPKYAAYQKAIRNSQILRAQELINNPSKIAKSRQNDPKRFVTSKSITSDGEIAEKRLVSLNETAIKNEEMFDGFYAVCTTLEDDIGEIIKVNKRRWEIEESFRILKSEFKARPIYLKNDDRIKAHFTVCFLSLVIYRILECKLGNQYTSHEIIMSLRNMNLLKEQTSYIPTYTRTDITDLLHNKFGFRTDYEILNKKHIQKILK